jgi:hypothetical protein
VRWRFIPDSVEAQSRLASALADRMLENLTDSREADIRRAEVHCVPAACPGVRIRPAPMCRYPPAISAEMAANSVASRRLALPKSVARSTTPADTMPMQISVQRMTASIKTSPFAPPGCPELAARDDRRRDPGKLRGKG